MSVVKFTPSEEISTSHPFSCVWMMLLAASKVIYEMMECSVEDVVLNLLCKIRVQAVKDWFFTYLL